MSLTLVRLACFRLGMAPLNVFVRRHIAKTAQPRTGRKIRPGNCPGFSGIAIRELLKSVSGTY
ncbi:hypothetical protein GGE07_001434 [Sinorhizobium terangae]|nr:hypothetical protein [Sinorhizobium terangae]